MKKQTVLITGASRGIGAAIARQLGSTNRYRLILTCYQNPKALKEVMDDIRTVNADCELFSISCNLSSAEELETMYRAAAIRFGEPDILINNAGIAHIGLLQDMSTEEIATLLNTDLLSTITLSRLCVPHMLHEVHSEEAVAANDAYAPDRFRSRCAIINISSVWGNVGAACEAVYSAAKGGVNSFTKALAKELAPSAIPVNAIACGMVATDMNACLTKEDQDDICSQIPAGRIASPDEIAAMVDLILQSPSYMTGQIITMDGGWI